MIKKLALAICFISFVANAQIQTSAPWTKKIEATGKKTTELTLEEISKSAEAYFSTIDRNKKGRFTW